MATAIVQQRGRKTAARKPAQLGEGNVTSIEVARLRLVPTKPKINEDAVRVAQELLAGALRGDIVGFVWGAMVRERHYKVGTCGEAKINPTFVRGMLRAIDDDVSKDVWGR